MSRPSKKIKKVLILGIGGGADIIGTIPLKIHMEKKGIECFLGGLPWERYTIDPYPGPRTFESILNMNTVNESIGLVSAKTKTLDGLYFSESKFSRFVRNKVFLINIFNSLDDIADDLLSFCKKEKIDCVYGLDVGGDVLARGDEKGLASPLADSIMLNVLYKISNKIKTSIGILGFGSDGELNQKEILKSLELISKKKGLISSLGIDSESYQLMKKMILSIETDASRIPLLAYEGKYGLTPIRRGRIKVDVHPMCQITFIVDTKILFKFVSKVSRTISKAANIFDASELLIKNNYPSEFNYEIKKHKEAISLKNIK
ncbi:MAG: DUF1152 domain-containing protein [Thermodesulfobacteriota bacterium]|nr:DUF1152 domain-containing protein [Thermodesulfobacteriota bacterium]